MKKVFAAFFALIIFCVSAPVLSAPKKYVIVYQETNFRSANSVTADKIAVVKPPASFEIVDSAKNSDGELWYKVRLANGKLAWVNSTVVNVNTINEETTISNQSLILDGTTNKINIRTGPSRSNSILKTVSTKDTFKIVSKVTSSDGSIWYKITLKDNAQGWVLSTVVTDFVTDSVKKQTVSGIVAIIDPLVNIRSLPVLDSALVTRTTSTIRPQVVNQTKDSAGNTWYEIVLPNGQHGWVRADMVRIDKPVSETPQKGLQVTIDPGTNIRSGAGTNFSKVTTTSKQYDLSVLASKPDVNGDLWYKLTGDFGTGWVMGSLVTVNSNLGYPTLSPGAKLMNNPSKNAEVITTIGKQSRCTISGAALTNLNERWYLVTDVTTNKTGWVLSNGIKTTGSAQLPSPALLGKTVEVLKETRLTTIPAGNNGTPIFPGGSGIVDTVAIRDKGQLYYRITSGKNSGWINSEFLKISPKMLAQSTQISNLQYEPINTMINLKIKSSLKPENTRIIQDTNNSMIQLYIDNALLSATQYNYAISSTLISNAVMSQVSTNPAQVKITLFTNKPVETYLEPYDIINKEIDLKVYPKSKDSEIKVMVKDKPVISSAAPYFKDKRVMVSLSSIKETLGYLIRENPDKNQFQLVMPDDDRLVFRIGDPQVDKYVSNIKNVMTITPSPEKRDGNVFVPIDQIAPVLGFHYQFNSLTRTIYLDSIIGNLDFSGCTDNTKGCSTMMAQTSLLPFSKKTQDSDGKIRITLTYAVLDPVATKNLDPKRVTVTSQARNGDKPPTVTMLVTVKENENLDISESRNPNRLIFIIKEKGATGLSKKTIFLDPGHGSFWSKTVLDTGCAGLNGLTESKVALQVTMKLSALLKSDGANVLITRTDETNTANPDLDKRIAAANNSGADLCLSLHFGYSLDQTENGCKTFYYSARGKKLADIMQQIVTKSVPGENMGASQKSFDLCRNVNGMPTAIIEPMYLSNERACQWLANSDNIDKLAQLLFNGIKKYFEGSDN